MAPAEAARIGAQAARGLAHAHARGVLHRDLTPSNVFVCEDGEVKLLDLGLSRVLAREGSPVDGHAGTPGYAPPERRRGEPEDARGDLYGLGAVLRLLLTGAKPDGDAEWRGGAHRRSRTAGTRTASWRASSTTTPRSGRPAPSRCSGSSSGSRRRGMRRPGRPSMPGGREGVAPPGSARGSLLAGLLVAAAAMFLVAPRGSARRPPDGGLAVAIAQPILAVGQTTTATAKPADGAGGAVPSPSWITSDPRVASVDSDGEDHGAGARHRPRLRVLPGTRGIRFGGRHRAPNGNSSSLHARATSGRVEGTLRARYRRRREWPGRGGGTHGSSGPGPRCSASRSRIPEGTDLVAVQVDVRVPASGTAGSEASASTCRGRRHGWSLPGSSWNLRPLIAGTRSGSRVPGPRCRARVLVDGDPRRGDGTSRRGGRRPVR